MPPSWPISISDGEITLRSLRRRDANEWQTLRDANDAWLAPWAATDPSRTEQPLTFPAWLRAQRKAFRRGTDYLLAISYDDELVGQVSVFDVRRASSWSASLGYWVAESHAGQGIGTRAVALAAQWCFEDLGMNRVEIAIQPHNEASLRLVQRLGFTEEGVRRELMYVDGAWRDHRCFVYLARDYRPGALLARAREL